MVGRRTALAARLERRVRAAEQNDFPFKMLTAQRPLPYYCGTVCCRAEIMILVGLQCRSDGKLLECKTDMILEHTFTARHGALRRLSFSRSVELIARLHLSSQEPHVEHLWWVEMYKTAFIHTTHDGGVHVDGLTRYFGTYRPRRTWRAWRAGRMCGCLYRVLPSGVSPGTLVSISMPKLSTAMVDSYPLIYLHCVKSPSLDIHTCSVV